MDDDFRSFASARYLNLETYRRDGSPVRTPLWFVEFERKLYVRTPANTGKIKRIRRNPCVRVVRCNIRGTPRGEWVEGRARLVEGAEAERANRQLLNKYGLQRRLIDFQVWLIRRVGHAVIAIER